MNILLNTLLEIKPTFLLLGIFICSISLLTIMVVPEITVCDKVDGKNNEKCLNASNEVHFAKYGTLGIGFLFFTIYWSLFLIDIKKSKLLQRHRRKTNEY